MMLDHEKLAATYGIAVYKAAEALHKRFLSDPVDGNRYGHWTLLETGSVEWWCNCVVLVLDRIHEECAK